MSHASCSFATKFGGLAAALAVRSWMGTLDYQALMYDPSVEPVRPEFRGPVIGVFWHEKLLTPFYLRGRTRCAILTSRHRDADWLCEAARHLGFRTVRGSTYRGGGRALLELMRRLGDHNMGIACDGPRGPRRKMAQGPVYLSSKLGIPLVAYGIGYHRAWRMPTWDRFALPRPFSRARVIISPRMQIPANLSREGVEHYRQRAEDMLEVLTRRAEAWAEAGTRKANQVCVRSQPGKHWRSSELSADDVGNQLRQPGSAFSRSKARRRRAA